MLALVPVIGAERAAASCLGTGWSGTLTATVAAPAIDEAGDVGSAADDEGEGTGPEGLGEGTGETPGLVGDEREVFDGGKEKGDGLGVGSSLGVVESAYGGLNERVCAESVKGVGRESDEAAALKNRDSLFDVGCAGG